MSFPVTEFLGVTLLGLVVGTSYGLLGIGLVIVYRSRRVINFAHGAIGAVAAQIFAKLALGGTPYYVSAAIGIAVGALLAVGVEYAIVRRLQRAPNIVQIVGTIGAGTFFALISFVIAPVRPLGGILTFPGPPGM